VGLLSVPLGVSDRDRWVRLHELAHAKWTPVTLVGADGIPFPTLNACEDSRIHKRLNEAGMANGSPVLLSDADRERMAAMVEDGRMPPIEAARLFLATVGTGDERPLRRLFEGLSATAHVPATCDVLWARHLRKRRPAWGRTVDLARDVEATFAVPPSDDPDMTERLRDANNMYREGDPDGGRWGPMTVETPPLTVPMTCTYRVPRRRASDTGAVPTGWHRLTTDGRVFTRKLKRPAGGAILIDQSGSMSLSHDDVQTIIDTYPGVTVGTYAGNETRGVLRIIARDGRRATDEDCYLDYGGNTVDGPALEWLAQQPGPRVWVSDGLIVGANGSQHPNLHLDVAQITATAQILRVPGIHHLTHEE
jgi:hypothetical protein